MALLKKISNFIASYKLSCVLFLLLLLLTYLGTIYQVENGLYQSQKKYFESIFLIHWAYGVFPVPLPGGYLLMTITFINIFWGAVTRFRMQWSHIGFMLMHAGILIMLLGAFVSYVYSTNGRMIINEGETSNEIENPYEWEIGISEGGATGTVNEYIIPQRDFDGLTGSRSRTFTIGELPVSFELGGFAQNTVVKKQEQGEKLLVLPMEQEFQQNMAGINVALVDNATGDRKEGIAWAGNFRPAVLELSGKSWNIILRKQRVQLPFSIRLDEFTHKTHPGTNMPREFVSEITKVEGGISQQLKITMNEPFRHQGYTFYQSSWGQQGDMSNREYSVLSAVKNPADQIPLYACLITTLGLVLHFIRKLVLYLRKEKVRQS
jgi:hypothetical protein